MSSASTWLLIALSVSLYPRIWAISPPLNQIFCLLSIYDTNSISNWALANVFFQHHRCYYYSIYNISSNVFGSNRQILLFFQLTGIFSHIEILFIAVKIAWRRSASVMLLSLVSFNFVTYIFIRDRLCLIAARSSSTSRILLYSSSTSSSLSTNVWMQFSNTFYNMIERYTLVRLFFKDHS